MTPTLIENAAPARREADFAPGATCFLIDKALDQAACRNLVRRAMDGGFQATAVDYPGSYRDNDRWVSDDPELAGHLFRRLRGLLPAALVDAHGDTYRLVGLNERFRFCRYAHGQQFRIHRDGAHARGDDERSFLTLQIYLDDASTFVGGQTRFYGARHGALVGTVAPRTGTAIVFDHNLWHDGEPVTGGRKHVMRTDVMYVRVPGTVASQRRGPAAAAGAEHVLRGHLGYVWAVTALADGSLVTASRDRTIKRWRFEEGAWHCVSVLRGHAGSIHTVVEPRPGVLVSGSRDHTLRVWDLATSTVRGVVEHKGAVLCAATLASDLVASGSGDTLIRLLGADGEPRILRGHRGWVWSLAAVGAGLLASASEDGTMRLWDIASRSCLDVAMPHHGPAHAAAALGEEAFAAGFADGTVVLYALDRQRAAITALDTFTAHRGEVYALAMLPGGFLATGGEDDCARVWRLDSRACVKEVRHRGFVRSITAVAGGLVASGGYDGVVRIWPACDSPSGTRA